jgi:hypothetical protein
MIMLFMIAFFSTSMLVESTYWFFLDVNVFMANCPRDASVLAA